MRLQRKRDAELAKRRGLAIRTIIAVIWFILCFVAAYYIVNWLFDSGTVTLGFFYNRFFIPTSVSEGAVRAGLMVVIVILIQFFVLLGFAFASPLGRIRPGDATLRSPEPDPNADQYDYR
jgi:hypothetical protein